MFVQARIRTITLTLLLVPTVIHAQTRVKSSADFTPLARAIVLHDSAVALYNQPTRSADAARLHLREAAFRDARDPEAVEALLMAANLFNYANQPISARKAVVQAAERALAIGDIATAAEAYTNAAFLALKKGSKSEMNRYAWKAILLTESPLMEQAKRASIRSRFGATPHFAELMK